MQMYRQSSDVVTYLKGNIMTSPRVTINIRTDKELKDASQKLFKDLGLDLSTAINMFLTQAVRDNAFPFTPARESEYSKQARREAQERIGKTVDSVAQLMEDLNDA